MRHIFLLFTALMLAACSMENMANKMVPDDIRANTATHIDALAARDMSLVREAFNIAEDNVDAQKQIEILLSKIPEGTELQRDIVSVNTKSSVNYSGSDGKQKSKTISLGYEVKMTEGFMLVTTRYGLDEQGECCMLMNIHVEDYETSPVLAGLQMMAKVMKIAGAIILFGLLALTAFLLRRRRQKQAASQT